MAASNDIVRLNVGGVSFCTTIGTLITDSGSHLCKWFDPTRLTNPLPCDRHGAYFLDRDPDTFKVILNYLRLKSSGEHVAKLY